MTAPNLPERAPARGTGPLFPRAQLGARVILALIFISYSAAKLVGTQFIRSGMLLDFPISDLSGFHLTWAYFGYSYLYSYFIALGQLVCGSLLLFDRTRRLGALGLLPITTNIVVVNFSYNISGSTKVISVIFLLLNLFVIATEFPAVKRFLWDETTPERPGYGFGRGRVALLGVMFVGIFFGFFQLRSRWMVESALHGDWTVAEVTVNGVAPSGGFPAGGAWEKVYFDYNWAFGARTAGGVIIGRFETDEERNTVRIQYNLFPSRLQPPVAAPADVSASAQGLLVDPDESAEPRMVGELIGNYRIDPGRSRILISGSTDEGPIQLVLVPWAWTKY